MATKDPVHISNVLHNASSGLADVVRRANSLAASTQELKSALPDAIRPHLVSVNFRADTLVLIVDSAAWAARLRYLESEVRSHLAKDQGIGVKKIDIKVRPSR